MKRTAIYISLLVILMVTVRCKGKDDSMYPSVQLEFVTAQIGDKGKITEITTDDGKSYSVNEDKTATTYNADQVKRIVANYELRAEGNDTTALVYSSIAAVASVPQTSNEFSNGIKTDPANVLSIWQGSDYLNIVLEVLSQTKTHTFAFIEQNVTIDSQDRTNVSILLYHDSNNDVKAYTKRAYLSIPISQYRVMGSGGVILTFSLYTDIDSLNSYRFYYPPR